MNEVELGFYPWSLGGRRVELSHQKQVMAWASRKWCLGNIRGKGNKCQKPLAEQFICRIYWYLKSNTFIQLIDLLNETDL